MARGVDPIAGRPVTQIELAKVLGITQGPMSERLRCKQPFDTDELLLIARHFQVDVTDLMGGVRSRCFSPLSLVADAGQMEFAFDAEPPVLATA